MASQAEKEEILEEEEMAEEGLPENRGLFDSLSDHFGAAPWWIISVVFHGLLILLIALLTAVVIRTAVKEMIITTKLENKEEQKIEKEKQRDILNRKENPIPSDLPPVEDAVVTHEDVEESDHNETDNNMDNNSAFGDEGISDVMLGGKGVVAAIGLGGGGGGAFGHRGGGGRRRLVRRGGGGAATESAVDIGLEWLAKHQEPDGHWDAQKYQSVAKTDTACTGFALLAFLGAGHTEKVGRYKGNVQRAVKWLKSVQKGNGCIYQDGDNNSAGVGHPGPGYPHAIAGMAMAEASGMARVADTVNAAQKAIDYSCQIHGCGELEGDEYGKGKGPWRYEAGMQPDTSVTGWYIMQLKSAKVSGLTVPNASFKRAIEWLDKVMEKVGEDDGYGPTFRYRYQPGKGYGGWNQEDRLCAIGCLGRQFTGTPKEQLEGSVNHFVKVGGPPGTGNWDLYYWYYGTLCVFQQGGEVWKRWNEAMKSALLGTQRKGGDEDGSWDPQGDCSSHWGRVGQTALSTLCLEVYYRYLPTYQQAAEAAPGLEAAAPKSGDDVVVEVH